MLLRTSKGIQVQKVAASSIVDAVIANPILVIDVRERNTRRRFHHLHAGPVIRVPVCVVGHFLDIGAGRAGTIGAGRGLCRSAGIGVAVDRRRNDGEQRCTGDIATRESGWRGRTACHDRGRCRRSRRRDGHDVRGAGGAETDSRTGARGAKRTGVDLGGDVGRNIAARTAGSTGGKNLDTIHSDTGDSSRCADGYGRRTLASNSGVGVVGNPACGLDVAGDTGSPGVGGGIERQSRSRTPTQRCRKGIGT